MYPEPQEKETTDVHGFVHIKQQAFQRAFELVRRHLNEKQKHRNALYSKKVTGPTYREKQKVLLYHPVFTVGTTSKVASPWRIQYIFGKCLNDVIFRIKEENSSKQQIVHYDRLKAFIEPPPTSNVPTRNKLGSLLSSQHTADTYRQIDGTLNHDDCLSFFPALPSVSLPIGRGTTTAPTN